MQSPNISSGDGASRITSQQQPAARTGDAGDVRSGRGPGINPGEGSTSASATARPRGSSFAQGVRSLVRRSGNTSESASRPHIEGFPVVGKEPNAPSFPATIDMKGKVDMPKSGSLHALSRKRSVRELSTHGRASPKVTPQTVGRYITGVVGNWEGTRATLPKRIVSNLATLNQTPAGPGAEQLHLEVALHFNCLCDPEKVQVLDKLVEISQQHEGVLDAGTPVSRFVEHMLLATPDKEAGALELAAKGATRKTLKPFFDQAGQTDVLAKKFPEFHMTMPLDHMVDYAGFMQATNRVYGTLPKEAVERHRVCVVGGGPAGIMAADGLNRLGVKVDVFEQADQIGGRLKTVRLPEVGEAGDGSGTKTPTPLEMGGMRFAPYQGNAYYQLAKGYDLPMADFINPGKKAGLLVVGGEVIPTAPGEKTQHALLEEVTNEYEKAMGPLMEPIFAARLAGDTVKFRELCDKAIERFDPTNFQAGLKDLLKDQGITWGDDKWKMYGAVGIGVGGYAGYYGTGFLEEFRFLADRRLENHVFLPGGANSVLHAVVQDGNLPNGQSSLRDKDAIHVNTEVEKITKSTDPSTNHAVYEVSVKHTDVMGNVTTRKEKFTELIFAGGPHEAIRLGITEPQAGSEPLMTQQLSDMLKDANLVGATKLAVKVPHEMLDNFEKVHGEISGIQSSEKFQQMYVLPPAHEDATSRVIFVSYQLGDNATKTASMGGEEQFNVFTRILRNIGQSVPNSAVHEKLSAFAEVVEAGRDRMAFEPWSQERHFGGAFKMDRPMEQANTQRMFETTLDKTSTDAIIINEMMSAEGGFASGAVSTAVNGVLQFIVRNGGEPAVNSPLDQERLYPLNRGA